MDLQNTFTTGKPIRFERFRQENNERVLGVFFQQMLQLFEQSTNDRNENAKSNQPNESSSSNNNNALNKCSIRWDLTSVELCAGEEWNYSTWLPCKHSSRIPVIINVVQRIPVDRSHATHLARPNHQDNTNNASRSPLSWMHKCIEMLFGILTNKWQILQSLLLTPLSHSLDIVMATSRPHSYFYSFHF